MDREVRGGAWTPQEGVQLFGKTLGVIGLGGIGREVARIAKGIGMEVIAYNRTPRPDPGRHARDRDDAAPSHLLRETGGPRSEQTLAHDRIDAVGADDHVGFDLDSVGEAGESRAVARGRRRGARIEPDGRRGKLCAQEPVK